MLSFREPPQFLAVSRREHEKLHRRLGAGGHRSIAHKVMLPQILYRKDVTVCKKKEECGETINSASPFPFKPRRAAGTA